MIYHISSPQAWQQAQQQGLYRDPSLESEGFIHFSARDQVVRVANVIYRGQQGLLLLCVDETRLQAPLKWEAPSQPADSAPVPVEEAEPFPHLYGALNVDAVVKVVPFPCQEDGTFRLPEALA